MNPVLIAIAIVVYFAVAFPIGVFVGRRIRASRERDTRHQMGEQVSEGGRSIHFGADAA